MNQPAQTERDGAGWRADGLAGLMFASEAAPRPEFTAAMQDAGIRALSPLPLSSTGPAFAASADLALIDLAAADDMTVETFVAETAPELAAHGIAIIAALTPAQIDLVALDLLPLRAELLCDPAPREIRAALERARERPVHRLHDSGGTASADRLRSIHEDVTRIAAKLRELAPPEPPQLAAAPLPGIGAGAVRALIRRRRLRDRFFETGLFADPAWDMLLDLYAAHLEGELVCVSSLCYAAAVPPTTALRWIGMMCDNGLLERRPDARDRRRHFIHLTDRAIAAMNAYFLSMAASARSL